MITKRDLEVIKFIEQFKVARTSTIQELFYPSLRVAQRRLKIITERGFLKRDQAIINQEYIYYVKKPKQLLHSILLTDFYREIHKLGFEIEYFDNEVAIEDIRPDGLLAYRYKDKAYISFVEVEISNKGLDIDKYKKLYATGKYKAYFPIFPLTIVITNQSIDTEQEFKIITIREDLTDISKLLE
jgi:predicted DNA-binding transcriptional regulator